MQVFLLSVVKLFHIFGLKINPRRTKKGSRKNRKPYRADWIRTNDLLNPIQALYQTELQPATRASVAKLAKKSRFCKSSFANYREWEFF